MNFREEYKNSIEIMSPSAEQLERMKKNILEQAKAPEKKAIPFKKIAYIGGAVAACAVISVAAINIIPRLSGGSSGLTAAESFNAVSGNAFEDGMMEAAADYAPEYVTEDKSISDDVCAKPDCDDAYISDGTYEPSFDPMVDYDLNAEGDAAADDACNDVIADVSEMTDAPTSSPVTTTAVNAGSSTDTPTEDVPASEDVAQDVVQDIETELLVEISADLSTIFVDYDRYILVDDGYSPPSDVDMKEERFTAGGTEYWLHFYGNDYLVMLCNYGNGGFFEVVGGYRKENTSFSTSAPNDTDEPHDTDDEPSFILSNDLSELVYDDVKYILYDETGPVDVPVIECMNAFDASGTEYWLDFSSEDYLLLSRDNGNGGFDLIGGYMKSE